VAQRPRKSDFMSSVFCIFLKIFIAQMGAFGIWKNPRMSKVQLSQFQGFLPRARHAPLNSSI
ncbi:hypothetical protein, partial [Ferrovum myxofaciens]|uniref:hypothetical protein n=1 Tax=Ferrovum myxofaciens TaxID=416213 RepID=UPI001F3CD23A